MSDDWSYATKQRVRGMLADKQAVFSIADELEVSVSAVQALADAKPKPVRARAPVTARWLRCGTSAWVSLARALSRTSRSHEPATAATASAAGAHAVHALLAGSP